MGRRGPAPKPTKLKLMAGNPGRRPLNDAEPEPIEGVPDCPDWLDEEGRACWNRTVAQLQRMQLAYLCDRESLAAYCQQWSVFVGASRRANELNAAGYIDEARKQNSVADAACSKHMQWADRFGLSPSARSRVKVVKKETKARDGKAEFFKVS